MRIIVAAIAILMAGGSPVVPAVPAAAQATTTGPFVVYFDAKKKTATVLTARARAILDNAARAYRDGGSASLVVSGYSDGVNNAAKVRESQQRAANVRDYLIAAGVPAGNITVQAFGATRHMVETTKPSPENRRVEITFGPGSGW